MQVKFLRKIKETEKELIILWDFPSWLPSCSNPQTKTLTSFNYSTEQVLWNFRRYVEGTAVLDWVTVIVKAVINTDEGTDAIG